MSIEETTKHISTIYDVLLEIIKDQAEGDINVVVKKCITDDLLKAILISKDWGGDKGMIELLKKTSYLLSLTEDKAQLKAMLSVSVGIALMMTSASQDPQ